MDISAFSEDSFDTKTWINNVLKSEENKENQTISLVKKLQLYVQQVNISLEQTSQQILISFVKIMRDTQNLHQEAMILKEKMNSVRDEIINIEQDTRQSLQELEDLDKIKLQLVSAKQGLHESDNWIVLANDLEEAFDSKNIDSIASKLVNMQQSLKLLVNVADYEERKLQLEGLKNRLEAIVSPSVVQAFTSYNIDQSIAYAKVFSSIDRQEQLQKYYRKCQKDTLLKIWRNQLEVEQDEPVTQWLHSFYNSLISTWHSQFKWINSVFPNQNATKILIEVYIDVLSNLDPSVNECVDGALKETSQKLQLLLEIKQITQQFANSIINVINSGKDKISNENILPLLQAVYNPLTSYIGKYAAYEQAHLVHELTSLGCIKEELPETIQTLKLIVPTIFDWITEAKKRCKDITENCGYSGFLIAIRGFMLQFTDYYKVVLRQLDRNKGKKEDWNLFQLCLSLLQNVGEVLSKLHELEKEITASVLEFDKSESTSIIEYKYLLLNSTERKEYDSLVKCVTEGTQLSLLDHVINEFNKLCSDIHHTTCQVIFAPILVQLDYIQNPKVWSQLNESSSNTDLPDYSYTPQEYITQIGQYLMTLPQHLEPFFFKDNPSLTCALKAVDPEYNDVSDDEGALADVFLRFISRGLCREYCDRILSIGELSTLASKQLAHDINYLENVLQDLGISLSESLKQIASLLKIPADQYQTQCAGYSARYVAAIRQMRNIKLSG